MRTRSIRLTVPPLVSQIDKKVDFKLNERALTVSAVSSIPDLKSTAIEEPLTTFLWKSTGEYTQKALNTKFIQGIKSGRLDPIAYSNYFLQDCVYCFQASSVFGVLKERASYLQDAYAEALISYAEHKQQSYKAYADAEFKTWHVGNSTAVDLSEAASSYIQFEREVAVALPNAVYTLIACLPCLRLWPWLAQQIKAEGDKDGNVYRQWILDNQSDSSATKLETYIDSALASYIDKSKALVVYTLAMIYECNFFLSACQETLLPRDNLREKFLGAKTAERGRDYLIVANGTFLIREIIAEAAQDKVIVALDGASNRLARIGIKPDIVLGDFDSVKEAGESLWGVEKTFDEISEDSKLYEGRYGVKVVPAKNQDLTDLDKAIQYCDQQNAKSIHIVCATGGRLDHHEATMRCLRREYRKDRPIFVYTEQQVLKFAKDEKVSFSGNVKDKCGIVAFPEGAFVSEGLDYGDPEKYFPLKFGYTESFCNSLKNPSATVTVTGETLIIMPAQLESQRVFMSKKEPERLALQLRDAERQVVEFTAEEFQKIRETRKAVKSAMGYVRPKKEEKSATHYLSASKEMTRLSTSNGKVLLSVSKDKFQRLRFFQLCSQNKISEADKKTEFAKLYSFSK